MDWAKLPNELLTTIFSFLSCKELTSAVCVNSTWNYLAKYDAIWKEAIFNESFPHPFSYSQKDVPWRQIVQRHFQVKKNMIKKRCVQHALGVRCPASNPRAEIILRHQTVSGKYCLLIWEAMESQGYSYSTHDYLATELWDLETRTIIANYSAQRLELMNDYLVAQDYHDYDNDSDDIAYVKFDPTKLHDEPTLSNKITVTNLYHGMVSRIQNGNKHSSLIALTWSNWDLKRTFIQVHDLRTGSKIFEKTFDDKTHLSINEFYDSKLVIKLRDEARILVIDVLQNKEISIKESQIACTALAGNDLWMACPKKRCLFKFNLTTRTKQKYDLKGDIRNASDMFIFDGIIWLYTISQVALIEITSATKSKVLKWISFPGWSKPTITQLPNGVFSMSTSSFVHTLSFMNADIELPIQVLQIEPNGKNKILNIQQGDLNKKIAECSPTSFVTSQIVFEDQSTRYCIAFSYGNMTEEKNYASNKYVDNARDWRDKDKVEYHKSAIFQLVYFDRDREEGAISTPNGTQPTAYGPCWVIYETKVNGAWQRAAPLDHWAFFKTKLGLK